MKLRKLIILTGFTFLTAVISFAGRNDKGIDYYRAELYDAAKIFFLSQTDLSQLEQAENYYFLGITYYQLNQEDSASFYYKKAIETLPTYPFGYIGEGKMQLLRKNNKAAEELFKKANSLGKKDPAVQTAIAEVYLELGDYSNTYIALDKAKKVNTKHAGIYLVEGDMSMKQGKEGDAAGCYNSALYFDSSNKLAYLKLAQIYKAVNPNVAMNNLGKLVSIDPEYIPANALLTDINKNAGNYKKALDALEKFINVPGIPMQHHETYAQLLLFTDQYEKAGNQIKYVLSKDPDNLIMMRLQAYNNFRLEKYDVGLEQMQKFLAVMPAERHIYQDYTTLAQLALKEKQNQKALDAFRKAFEMDTTKYELYREMGSIALGLKMYSEAIDFYEKFLLKAPEPEPFDFLNLGISYLNAAAYYITPENFNAAKSSEEFEEFEGKFKYFVFNGDKAYQELIKKKPELHYGYIGRANIISLIHQFDINKGRKSEWLAKPLFEEAIPILQKNNENGEKNKDILTAYSFLLAYYVNAEDKPNMANCAKNILQLDPKNEAAIQTLTYLKKLNFKL